MPIAKMKFHTNTDWLGLDEKWAKNDALFFRSGACHILATAFLEKHTSSNFRAEVIYPINNVSGSHVFVSNGNLAFDYRGYVDRKQLIESHKQIFLEKYKSWDYELIKVEQKTDELTSEFWSKFKFVDFRIWGNHRDPKKRAHEFLSNFSNPELHLLSSIQR